jgi:hypothetical protein
MRLASGCLAVSLALIVVLAGATWVSVQMLRPADVILTETTVAEGKAAQDKLYAIIARTERSRPGKRSKPVVLSEREVNAFFSRHLGQVGDLPLTEISVRLPAPARLEMTGRIPLRYLLSDGPFAVVSQTLPQRWLDRSIWLSLGADARIETPVTGRRRYLKFDVRRFRIGRQAMPTFMPQLLLDAETLRLLRWPLPDGVDDVRIEPGRAIITLAS